MRREALALAASVDAAVRAATARAASAVVPRRGLGEALHGASAATVVVLILAGVAGVVAAPHDPVDVLLSFGCLGLSMTVWSNETCAIRALVDVTPPAELERTLAALAEAATIAERPRRVGMLATLPSWPALAACMPDAWSAALLVALPCAFVLATYARTVRPCDLQA